MNSRSLISTPVIRDSEIIMIRHKPKNNPEIRDKTL